MGFQQHDVYVDIVRSHAQVGNTAQTVLLVSTVQTPPYEA